MWLNGKKIPIKAFKDYVDFFIKGHEDASGNQMKAVYEQVGIIENVDRIPELQSLIVSVCRYLYMFVYKMLQQ